MAINQADSGSPNREQTGRINKKLPNSASFISKVVLIVGIRAAQEEKEKPDKKNNRLSAIRFCFLLFKVAK